MNLAPVDTLPAVDLANQLGSGSFPQWTSYNGVNIGEIHMDSLLHTDAGFLAFWTQRWAEEVLAFERILAEGDFLDTGVADFYEHPAYLRVITRDTRTMRVWAQERLDRARQAYQSMFS